MSSEIDINKYFEEFLQKYKNKECNEIYFLKNKPFPFILQIKQLIRYLIFKKQLNYYLSNKGNNQKSKDELIQLNNDTKVENSELINQNTYIQNKFYLIDANWIKKWKKHIGYKEIKRYFKNIKNSKLTTIDYYNHFSSIIEKNSSENPLYPLDNKNIFNEKGIDPLKNFKIIDKECYNLFIIGGKEITYNKMMKSYPVRLLEQKYIIILDPNFFDNHYIVFKERTHNKNFEILIIFEEVKEDKKNIIDDFASKNINEWLN